MCGSAVRYAGVISQCQVGENFSVGEDSWTSAEVATMNSALAYAAARHVTVVAARETQGVIGFGSSTAGQGGHPPASDPLVLGVGGTSLTANPGHRRVHQRDRLTTPCPGLPPSGGVSSASGGGFQPAVPPGPPYVARRARHRRHRGVPDVAGDASGPTRHGARVQRARRAATSSSGPAAPAQARRSGPA